MAECLLEAFGLSTDVSLLYAEYFRATALALSDDQFVAFIPDNELVDLLCLSLDHLLEYEYGNPTLIKHMGDVLNLYERFQSDHGAVHGKVGRLWEDKSSSCVLPLTIGEVRTVFPFPLMNPIVRGNDPDEMQKRWEGEGLPLWKWSRERVTCWFFASPRDFTNFLASDDFVSNVMPDGTAALCLFPPDCVPKNDTGLAQWCRRNGKLGIDQIPQLLADFLLSGTGDLTTGIPGDLQMYLELWANDKTDVLLTRKAQIYSDALLEIVRGAQPQPKCFFKEPLPPDADTVWGYTQVADRTVAVISLALAWADLTTEQKATLARLRDLFRIAKDGKGSGDLNRLKPSPGVVSVADDLLPRYGRTKTPTDSHAIQRIESYWPLQSRMELVRLARIKCPWINI